MAKPKQEPLILPALAVTWIIETLGRIERRLIELERKADANGQQAATWTTPKSWPKAQERPPESRDGGKSA